MGEIIADALPADSVGWGKVLSESLENILIPLKGGLTKLVGISDMLPGYHKKTSKMEGQRQAKWQKTKTPVFHLTKPRIGQNICLNFIQVKLL